MDWKPRTIAALVVLGGAFFATPALAQETQVLPTAEAVQAEPLAAEVAQVDPEAGLVNGVFGLTLEGEVPEDFSFYAEANIGSGGEVICTTDADMIGVGYPECVGGGAVNEVSFVAPDGQNIQYRILGSQGAELSQKVISEGTAVAAEGVRIDASYTFGPEPLEDFSESPIQDPEWEPDVDEDQYGGVSSGAVEETGGESLEPAAEEEAVILAEEAAANVVPGSVADIATGGTGLLPDTGGVVPWPIIGAVLLAGGLLARRLIP
jgi:hypothetical protein